jgi:hypothetical protein
MNDRLQAVGICGLVQGWTMRRATVNFIVDAIAFLDLLCLMGTGMVLKRVLPPGSGGGGGYGQGFRGGRGPVEAREWLGMGRHDWGDVHFKLSVVFVVLILVHIVLHWNWITGCAKSVFARTACSPSQAEGPAQSK